MKDLKRILLLVIAIVLSVSLCACDLFGSSDDETDDSTTSGEEVTTPGEGETTSGDKLGNEVPPSQVSGEHKPEESTDKKLTFVAAVQGEENDYVTLKTFVDTVVSAIASPDGSLTYEDTISNTYWTVDGVEADANTPVKNGSVVCAHAREDVGPGGSEDSSTSGKPDDPNPDDPNPDDPNPDDPNPDDPNPDDPNPDDPNPDDPNPDDPNPDDPNPDDPNP
ncbi:MAG: hypothetical protein IJX13_03045, partial [Clostridia bacterium]|nr:hypothetical protein [Clostridia bacterium]